MAEVVYELNNIRIVCLFHSHAGVPPVKLVPEIQSEDAMGGVCWLPLEADKVPVYWGLRVTSIEHWQEVGRMGSRIAESYARETGQET